MKAYLHQLFPKEFFTSPVYFRAIVLALVYGGILLAQLFHFEDMADIVYAFRLPGGHVTAVIVAGLLPLSAAVALPYLLSMRLSKRSRMICRSATIATPALWVLLGIWLNITAPQLGNAGLFGATLAVPVGLWLIVFSLLWLWSAILVTRELPARKA